MDVGLIIVAIIRLIGPLLMFKWPVVGVVLSQFIFDSFDVVIWDYTGSLALNNYTFYDKLFDTYQLILMAIVVLRWEDRIPKRNALVFFWFRMVGFVLYELTRQRIFFFAFPNLFGLYFLGYYIVKKLNKLKWYTKYKYLPVLILIMLILKMPQEYILHFAEIPTWDIIKSLLRLSN